MTKEKFQAFAQAVSKSAKLQERLGSIQVETAKSTAEKIAKLSESAGTPFTAEEYLQALAESANELSESQLGTVAGGAWRPTSGNILASIFTAGLLCAVTATISAAGYQDADICQIQY